MRSNFALGVYLTQWEVRYTRNFVFTWRTSNARPYDQKTQLRLPLHYNEMRFGTKRFHNLLKADFIRRKTDFIPRIGGLPHKKTAPWCRFLSLECIL